MRTQTTSLYLQHITVVFNIVIPCFLEKLYISLEKFQLVLHQKNTMLLFGVRGNLLFISPIPA